MKTSSIATIAVVVVLSLWMLSGLLNGDDESDNERTAGKSESLMKVEVMPVELSPTDREVVLQGQLDPWRQVDVRAEVGGTVARIAVQKGDRVDKGALLVELDPGSLDTDLLEAQARVKSAASEEEAASSLQSQGLQSRVQLEQLKAQLETARAQLARAKRARRDTRILAPFAAAINDLPVEVGELVQIGDVVAELVDDSRLKASAQAAQQSVSELAIGQSVKVELIDGERLDGTLTFISPLANSRSRSFRIEARVDNPNGKLAAGVSATLRVPVERVRAAFISPSVFSLDDQGVLGVKLVDADNEVVFQRVRLLRSDLDGAWVADIPEGARLITLGQGFVSAGERVTPGEAAAGDTEATDRAAPATAAADPGADANGAAMQ